ncbi:unnamed protein product [Didymodactylos carnosus]|uniref:Uncharacterized protein n=1 Tax=Didymodactylos carnosus TaxID=1234261 RepID=A0A813V8R8_9BILA
MLAVSFSSDKTIDRYSKISSLVFIVDDYSCQQSIRTCLFRRDHYSEKQPSSMECEAYIQIRKCLEIDLDIRHDCDISTTSNLKTILNENHPNCQQSYTQALLALSHSKQRTKPYSSLFYITIIVVLMVFSC